MFEKVNPSHPDKLADRIAGALVDIAYEQSDNPKMAVEVLIGHGWCHVIAETDCEIEYELVESVARRVIGEDVYVDYVEVPQDSKLAGNQKEQIRCGDNGIFKGVPVTAEQRELTGIVRDLYNVWSTDGKFVIDGKRLIACQSNAPEGCLDYLASEYDVCENPLGYWVGGPNVDCGATNRKLGSDMGDSITGGGLHGKDLSKADVSVNVYAWIKAQMTGETVELCCAIGDEQVGGVPYSKIVEIARDYISAVGGFEKFAEWGLVR